MCLLCVMVLTVMCDVNLYLLFSATNVSHLSCGTLTNSSNRRAIRKIPLVTVVLVGYLKIQQSLFVHRRRPPSSSECSRVRGNSNKVGGSRVGVNLFASA